jgi:hypothetical protein
MAVLVMPSAVVGCSGSHSLSNSGTVSDGSGDYSNEADCTWHLHCDSGHPRLQFSSFYTESNFDYVSVYDGSSSSASRLLHYAGSNVPSAQAGSGSSMTVIFHTDGSGTHSGFSSSFSCGSACSGSHSLSNSGTVSDGSGDYHDHDDCTWHLHCDSGHPRLQFSSFYTEGGDDFVSVYDGSSSSASRLLHHAGSDVPSAQTGSGSSMTVTFVTDGSVTHSGFSSSFSCRQPPSAPPHRNDDPEWSELTILAGGVGIIIILTVIGVTLLHANKLGPFAPTRECAYPTACRC